MRDELDIQPEAFEFHPGLGEFEAWSGEAAGAWQQEVNRGSAGYIRWLQESLNRVLGLKLTADGIIGPQTRSAIRSFQQRQGLGVDGIVGPATEAALIATGASPPPGAARAVCPPPVTAVACPPGNAQPTGVLDDFGFDKAILNTGRHTPRITSIAQRVIASQSSTQPIRSILIAGHTDPVGPPTYNLDLGRRRATTVAQALCDTLEGMRPGITRSINFQLTSCGEDFPKATPQLSRRVELFLLKRTPQVPPPQPLRLDPSRWRPILNARLSPHAALRDGNAVQFLIDGPAAFRSMVAAIRSAGSAQHYVYLLGWSLKDQFEMIPGLPSSTLRRLLADASARRVQVRAMLWDQPLRTNTAEVDRIDSLPTGAAILDDATPHHVIGAHHQKVLVVKGEQGLIAYCGGVDINDDRITVVASGAGQPQHDVHCRIIGPSAWDLLQTFIRRWEHHPKGARLDRARGPLLGRHELPPARIISPPPGSSSTRGTCSVAIARTFIPVTRGTTVPREGDIRPLLLQAIANARRFIYMEDQYLINLEAAAALRAALPNINHLTMLIGASEITDLPCVWKYRREFVGRLAGGLAPRDLAKVRIFRLITPPPSFPPRHGHHTYVHAKSWVFGDELAVIGSANCNRRGWLHDSEVNAFIFDDPARPTALIAPTFAQLFRMQLWSEHLSAPPSALADGVASASLWLSPPSGARIMRYDPLAGRDTVPDVVCDSQRFSVDPFV